MRTVNVMTALLDIVCIAVILYCLPARYTAVETLMILISISCFWEFIREVVRDFILDK